MLINQVQSQNSGHIVPKDVNIKKISESKLLIFSPCQDLQAAYNVLQSIFNT